MKSTNNLGYTTTVSNRQPGRAADENLIHAIVEARISGMTYSQICKRLKISRELVSKVLNQSFN